jgi:DNA primase
VIAQDTIERIRERVSIASIIGESVKLERRGRSLLGLCPFHKEKTPSFHVNEERGRYHCFGCQASGDVYRFLQETEGLTFVEAIRRLGEKVGIPVEDDLSDQERQKEQAAKRREQALFELNATAAVFFERMLENHPGRGAAQRELERRALAMEGESERALRAFRVGYAPGAWDELATHLKQAGHDLHAAETVGLVAARRQGDGYYDRFRQRLMFAILDLSGRVVGFSGRALEGPPLSDERNAGEPPAKYINSPESPIYKKRNVVFGLFQARAALRDGRGAVLVEGNFDVVSLHARGLGRAVAPLGTAFTAEQGRAIRRFTGDIVILFDGDRAGREATLKAREPAEESGLSVRVVRLPDGLDPDDFSRTRGMAALEGLVAASRSMLDYRIAELLNEQLAHADPEARSRQWKKVVELLNATTDPNVRAMAQTYADTLAARLGVFDPRTMKVLSRSTDSSLRPHEAPARAAAPDVRKPGEARGERQITAAIVGAVLDFPALLDSDALLSYSDEMVGDLAAAIACLERSRSRGDAAAAGGTSIDFGQALAKLPASLQPFAEARIAAPLYASPGVAENVVRENVAKLRKMEFEKLKSSTISELEKTRGDVDNEELLLREQHERARKRRGME